MEPLPSSEKFFQNVVIVASELLEDESCGKWRLIEGHGYCEGPYPHTRACFTKHRLLELKKEVDLCLRTHDMTSKLVIHGGFRRRLQNGYLQKEIWIVLETLAAVDTYTRSFCRQISLFSEWFQGTQFDALKTSIVLLREVLEGHQLVPAVFSQGPSKFGPWAVRAEPVTNSVDHVIHVVFAMYCGKYADVLKELGAALEGIASLIPDRVEDGGDGLNPFFASTQGLQRQHLFNEDMMYGGVTPEGAQGLVPRVKTLEMVISCANALLMSVHSDMEGVRMAQFTLLGTCVQAGLRACEGFEVRCGSK